jgi:tyrosyl-tRNA synthetase
MRQLQDLGHTVIFLIGDFTAMIGDPTGRSSTRPPLTYEEISANAKTYTDQAFLVLDKDRTEVVFNGSWFKTMAFTDVIKLNARVTLQQMLQREDFKNRVANGQEVRLHELQYPIMQGWDSVVVRADVEIGGSDQLFNILVGRDLQKEEGQEPQVVMTLPLLEGLDGVKKMSKSLGNYVGLTDEPKDMFGKLMSIPDALMAKYYLLVLGETLDAEMHPAEAKKQLAARCVAIYHSEADAAACREDWDLRFSKKDLNAADLPVVNIGERNDLLGVVMQSFTELGATMSGGDARRLIQQGSVQLNGEKVTDPKATPEWASGEVLKLDKKRSVRIG